MAFEIGKLAPGSVGLGGTPNRWNYGLTLDTVVTAQAANYFLDAQTIRQGDIILVASNAVDPYEVAELLVSTITLDGDGNRVGIATVVYNSASASQTFLTIESPAFDTTDTIYLPVPLGGTVTDIRAINNAANTTAAVTLTFNIGGVPITDGTLIFSITEPAGVQLVTVPTGDNIVSKGNSLEVVSSGGGAAITATIVYTIS